MKNIHRYVVVDDDATNNLICEFAIRSFHKEAEVSLFREPEEALEAIRNYSPGTEPCPDTILFLDVNMPAMTGWEFLEAFQQFDPAVRDRFVIYILTSSIEDFTEEAEKYPFIAGFRSKPLKTSCLEEIGV